MLGTAIGAGLGLATANWQDKRQLEQQKKLQELGIAGSKEMGKFNQGLALEMWDKTNYKAQRQQMEKAGLNVGLMYGGGGAGGGTTSTPTGSVASGNAPSGGGEIGMGIQMGLTAEMQTAQIENIKANTEKTKVDTVKTAGVDTEAVVTGIAAMKQNTANAAIQEQILEFEKQIKGIEANIAERTQYDLISQQRSIADKLLGEAESAYNAGKLSREAYEDNLKQIKIATTEAQLRVSAQKAGLIKTDAETKAVNMSISKMANEINMAQQNNMREWDKMSQQEREIAIKQLIAKNQTTQTEFNTSTAAQVHQWTEIITDIFKAGKTK